MALKRAYEYIVRTRRLFGGKPHIDGLRIRVQDIAVCHEHFGLSPDEICDQLPPLTLAQVHSALAYYFDHRDEIQAEIAADEEFAEAYRRQHPERIR